MTPTLIDHNLTLYTFLASQTALMTAISNRLYGGSLQIPDGMTQAQTALLFACDGGPGDRDIPMASRRFQFYCYGATNTEARTVFRELFDALHRKGRTDVTITTGVKHLLSYGELVAGPSDLAEPELGWSRVVCAFQVRFGERVTTW